MGTLKPSRSPNRAHKRRRTALVVLAPLVSVATLMLGLRVGAGNAVRTASVFVAPPGKPLGSAVPLALQLLTYLEDRGVRETVPMRDLTVVARAQGGKGPEARWTGSSNLDGIAEASLAFPELADGDSLTLEVLAAGESAPLASGVVQLAPAGAAGPTWGREAADDGVRAAARPSKRQGAIGIDLVVEGERLVVGFETRVWAHLVAVSGDRLDPRRLTITPTPEPGLELVGTPAITCGEWVELDAIAQTHVVGLEVTASEPKLDGRTGVWFGVLPVAPGAFYIGLPRAVPVGEAQTAVLVAPNPRNVVYAEVDDERGRVFAAALPVTVEPGDPIPRARFAMPGLARGLHWLVVSGEPRGAERLAGAAIAKPFLVGDGAEEHVDPREPCSIGPWLARRPASGFPRRLAFDGMETRGASNRFRHRAGLFIGLVSLLAAAILEVLLLTAASREARASMLLAELDGDGTGSEAERVTAKTPGGGLIVALLVAVLGFALLATLMIAKA